MSKSAVSGTPEPRLTPLAKAMAHGRKLALTGILGASLLSVPAYAAEARQYQLNPGALGDTLTNFAAQSGAVIYFDSEVTSGLSTDGLNGSYTVEEALARLLSGTSLQVVEETDGSYRITTLAGSSREVLEPVTINGKALGLTTESTGSYTTGEMTTATRLGLSVRETPQTVTVVTYQRIKDQALDSLNDVVNNTIGVSANGVDSSRNAFSARGFDINNIQIDGVPTNWTTGWSAGETLSDVVIYDRVEVVKGASGLVTGAGDPSAAINLVRKHATSDVATGEVSVKAGSWDRYQATFDVSTPLDEEARVRTRFVGSYTDAESFSDLLQEEKTVLYGVIDADLTLNTTVSAGISYQDNDPKGSMWGGLPTWFSDGSRTNWSRSKTTAADWTHWSSTNTNTFANVQHQFANDATLYAAVSRTDSDADMELLYLFGAPDKTTGLGMGAFPSKYDVSRVQDNIDVYANIPFDAFEQDHEAVVGVMFNDQDFESTTFSAASASAVGNFLTWDGSYPKPVWNAGTVSEAYETEQLGAYGALRLSLNDATRLILGARVTNWKRNGQSYGTQIDFEADNEVTSYAGITYDFNEQYTAFASYTDIFMPQDAQDINGNFLEPVVGGNYETGLKAELFGGRLNVTGALFRIEQDNLAQDDPNNIGVFVPGTTKQASIAAEGTTSQGFELEMTGELAENWQVSMGYSQFEAEDAQGKDVNTRHPRKTAKLFTTYTEGAWTYGGGVNWQSETYTDTSGGRISQSAYALVDVMARYQISEQLSAQLNVKNLFDETYFDNVGFFSQLSYGAPRSALLSLNYSF